MNWQTRGVDNQRDESQDYNPFDTDAALKEAMIHAGAGWPSTASVWPRGNVRTGRVGQPFRAAAAGFRPPHRPRRLPSIQARSAGAVPLAGAGVAAVRQRAFRSLNGFSRLHGQAGREPGIPPP
ncbi:hypothetical protein CV_4140 [Chromobacterium violaceum ATCC 12472]|uniref:Uncharacterized protein n=1 Tax=Chromobacterium violaceum (strain ATCC 12472 / DSM 30191 / JCM 1249 / CCUG 213 / NBRC 12614 / NCIMB 9131 / NCTC 9757 / MK) TaxID=243365 RepID=Q7NQJ7_CHRVO|nr:hypothetical protein CV_4140 [Chromobacterium violaceum ATCC 12472]